MSMTDELQQRFEGALASLSPSTPPPTSGLHTRLRKHRLRRRGAFVAASVAVVALGLSIELTSAPSPNAGAVVLRAAQGTQMGQRELSADATLMRSRLARIGDIGAHVSISGDTIVVTGGPVQLSDPSSPLTQSPSLLVRPVLCLSGPYVESSSGPGGSLPSSCDPPYAIQPATPIARTNGAYSVANSPPDPALAAYPSTTPVEDLAHPGTVALLPGPASQTFSGRYLVGPTELTLSSKVASAHVAQDQVGNWVVKVQLGSAAASQWNQVAEKYFHLMLAVDLNGQIVTAPVIEPTQPSYMPFDELTLSGGFSQGTAEAVAAALQTGPLPIPLQAG
jgi:preprotein translocase subunit SecD